jgi:hypothetical protein
MSFRVRDGRVLPDVAQRPAIAFLDVRPSWKAMTTTLPSESVYM